ncbi:MAG: hypothetical protein LBU50_05880, partial [Cellulomonas sp.]|nr:hypothetical protein [Cellulomonas sp.]
MSTMQSTVSRRAVQSGAVVVGVFGLVAASLSVMYVAGMFGLSTAFATQIVNAVEVGGWVLA